MKKSFYDKYICLSWRSLFVFVLVMGGGAVICSALQKISTSDVHVPMIFVLAVLIISLLTDGYFFGILAAVVSVFGVNWAFTYPYMKLDFSGYGYPLTFVTMAAVGVAASTLGSRMREQQRLRVEAEREKMRANLLRSVSHDLRTPLTAISGSLSTVLDSPDMPVESRNELLTNARDDADWLYRMVENLLSITRISGDGAGEIVTSDEVLEEILADSANKFKTRNPGITVNLKVPDTVLFVSMDAMLIEQALMNLLDNAVIHGETTTEIGITAEDCGEMVSICVADNGKGIDPAIVGRLFDGSIEPDGKTAGDNNRFMGIGLAVCRTIIEAHGGTISARNLPAGGAEFRIVLPKTKGEDYNEYT